MSKHPISLIDPMLYHSSLINQQITQPINFWKRFSFVNFTINCLIPVIVLIFIAFVLKYKYKSKQSKFINTFPSNNNNSYCFS